MAERHPAAKAPPRAARTWGARLRTALLHGSIGCLVFLGGSQLAPAVWPSLDGILVEPIRTHGVAGAAWRVFLPIPVWLAGLVVAHELGHLAAARSVGMRPAMVGLGPVVLVPRRGRLRVGRNRFTSWQVGFAASVPDPTHADLRWRHAVEVLGGPIANLVVAGACALCVSVGVSGFVAWHATQACVGSAVLAFVNLVPFRIAGMPTDGSRLLVLWRGGPPAERLAAAAALAGAAHAGIGPRRWPASWLEALDRGLDFSSIPDDERWNTLHLRVPARLGQGATREAERLLRCLEDHELSPQHARHLHLTASWLAARAGDAGGARAHLKRAPTAARQPWGLEPAARAALAVAEGRPDEAAELAADALRDRSEPLGNELFWRGVLVELAEGGAAPSEVDRVTHCHAPAGA